MKHAASEALMVRYHLRSMSVIAAAFGLPVACSGPDPVVDGGGTGDAAATAGAAGAPGPGGSAGAAGAGGAAGAAGAGDAAGGGDEPEAAIVWLDVVQGTTNECDRATSFRRPEGAPAMIQGPREEDGVGSNVIDCRVRATAGGAFEIDLSLRSPPAIRLLEVSGTVSEGVNQVRVSIASDTIGSLQQQVCDAAIEEIRDGAISIRALRCSNMTDPQSPGTRCAATGGVLFEHCRG